MLVLVAGTLALVGFVGLNAYLGAVLLKEGRFDRNLLLHPAEALARFGLIAACALLGWIAGLSPAQLGWRQEELVVDIMVGLLSGAVLHEINHRGTRLALLRWGKGIYSPAFLRVLVPRGRREWALTALALLPAALAEEMLFRSLAIAGFASFLPALPLAIIFAVVFGLAHLPQGRLGVVGASALGLLLGLLFLWRWSVVACTIAHYTINMGQMLRAEEELGWFEGS